MGIIERLLAGRGGDANRQTSVTAMNSLAGRPRAAAALLWTLCGWTALCGLALLFFQGGFSRSIAAGLADGPGQRLLGVQFLALAAVYALVARGRAGRWDWLPLGVQSALTAVIAIDWIAGNRDFGATAFALAVHVSFALLLAAFRLAGETTLHEPSAATTAWPAETWPTGVDARAPTERLTHGSFALPANAADPATIERAARASGGDASDDRVLGV